MDDLTPFPIDPEGTLLFLQKKIPDWHNRLKDVEDSCQESGLKLDRIETQISEMHTAFIGSVKEQRRGVFERLNLLEAFKTASFWALGVLYIAFITSVVGRMFIGK